MCLSEYVEYQYGDIKNVWMDIDFFNTETQKNVTRNDFITYTLYDASRFREFRQPCAFVHAYDEVVDIISHVYVQSDGTVTCYLKVGLSNGETQMVILSPTGTQGISEAVT